MGGVLALDLSSITGWAHGPVTDRVPSFGCWMLPRTGGEGARYAAFENEIAAAMDRLSPSHVVLEAPLSFEAMAGISNAKVMAQQYTLRGIAYAEAWRASVPVMEVSSDLVRLGVLGQSRFAKGTVKTEVVRYCRELGLRVPDHNAGDAVLTWFWARAALGGGPLLAGPLFREVRGGIN